MTYPELALSPPRPQASRRLVDTAWLCVVEARPAVLLIFLLRLLVGSALSGIGAPGGDLIRVAETALVWELAVFAVYLYNGVTDVHEDRINGSRRPIARGALPTSVALGIAAGAAMVSISGALALGTGIFWAVLALLAFGFCYSSPLVQFKRYAITSGITGMSLGLLTYHAGHTAYTGNSGSYSGEELLVFMLGATIWMGLVGGLTKDLSDVAGDAAAGRRSVAGVCGEDQTRHAAAAAALVLALGFCVAGVSTSPLLVWPGMAMLIGALAMFIVCLGGFAEGSQSRSRRPYRVFMTTQYIMNLSVITPLVVRFLFG